ncbi:tetratricopeptide repeat protein [Curtobacterium sp. VKM Ac-1393]|uniref:tetratricopeptide repeat protein n=1 Tax=Curtobacterium sp. VKM Ac-1393 TaxID=2783814 RepID=UPI00188BE7F7|nr:tetratricopeptide repeat protein [Curtobacterium sp. VKM Ac-1393]MBF4608537.1 tetratricopeptide repeat protein [Curtobacterium sp. VKM Ac-1393]
MTTGERLARAMELRIAGRPREALTALAGLPADHVVQMERALALVDVGEPEEAFGVAVEAVGAAPDDVDILLAFAHVADRNDEHGAALGAAERAIALAPDDLRALVSYAARAVRWPEYEDRAAAAITAAFELAPTDPDVPRTLGDMLLGTGRYSSAIEAYERALRLSPTDSAARQGRAAALSQLGRETAAVEGFWGVVTDSPGNVAAVGGLRLAALGSLQRLRVLIGGSAIAAFFAGIRLDATGATPTIALVGWTLAAAMLVVGAALVVRLVRRNRTPVVRLLRADRLLAVTVAVLGVAALAVLLSPTIPTDFPWLPTTAFGLVAITSLLSVVLHYRAAPPPPARPRDGS